MQLVSYAEGPRSRSLRGEHMFARGSAARGLPCCDPGQLYALVRDLFLIGSVCCVLMAAHRIAAALKLSARIEALEKLADAYTDEEREVLVHKIKARSLYG